MGCQLFKLFSFSFISYLFTLLYSVPLCAQSVSYGAKTTPNVDFTFNSMNKYVNGITVPNAITLNVDATLTQWDLYVGATTSIAGLWDNTTYYSTTGSDPDVGMIEVQFRNTSKTSLVSGYFPLTDIATPTDIIGNHLVAPDAANVCTANGTNTAGSYIANPNCYRFNVDLRITPGLSYRAGLYTMRIDFVLAQDL